MNKHVFDIEVAQIVGVNAAVLLENIARWVEHNQYNEEKRSFHDGRYWTYNSMRAFGELFPYLKPNAIRTALKKLKDADLLLVGNFNKLAYDRTQWYALTEKAEALLGKHTSICKKPQMDLKKNTNGFVTNDKPIPDVTSVVTSVVTSSVTHTPIAPNGGVTDTTPSDSEMNDRTEEQSTLFDAPTEPGNEPKHRASTGYSDEFEAFWAVYPLKLDKRAAFKAFTRALKRVKLDIIMAGARKYADDPNLPEPRFIKHASTWLNGDGWDNPPLPSSKPVSGQPNKAESRFNDAVRMAKELYAEEHGGSTEGMEIGR